jgi:predicted O-linked N-acetylglucosamine transferase (SPINDLY family)
VTCSGETFASRVAASLLEAVGMPELVTGSLAAYEALALRLARSPVELGALRERLARARARAPLFDTPSYVRSLEAAYEKMWEAYSSGAKPRLIEP